jgi:putative two-component system response regulator
MSSRTRPEIRRFDRPTGRPVKILISDDEPLMVAVLRRHLERLGYDCIFDTSGSKVLDLARQHQPDLIILDMQQSVDGRDLLARLKRDVATASCKVIVLSAVEDPFVRQTCMELGAVDYELKPFDPRFFGKITRLVSNPLLTTEPAHSLMH